MKPNLLKSKIFLCLVLTFFFAEWVYSQEAEIGKYPSKPITFINPVTAGGATDLALRLICKEAEKSLGQPIVVVNQTGGMGLVGMNDLAKSKPDGYTIGFLPHSLLYITPFREKVPFSVLDDFKPIIQFAAQNMGVTVRGNSPYKDFGDLISYARKNPQKLTCGTTGLSSMQYYIMEYIARKENVRLTQIFFKGNQEVQMALLGGHIDLGAGDFNKSLIETGQMKPALLFRDVPSPEYPKIPILKDFGYDLPTPMILNVFGPKGLPSGILNKIEGAFERAMNEPASQKGIKEIGFSVAHRNSKELTDYVARNYEIFSKLTKELMEAAK